MNDSALTMWPISNDAFDDAFQQVHDADTDDSLSEYEVLTIMAFLLCQSHDIDPSNLETGLGGRLDATNVVPSSTAIITDISFDHCDILGHTMAEIAAEKAGIIKPHSTTATHHTYMPMHYHKSRNTSIKQSRITYSYQTQSLHDLSSTQQALGQNSLPND